MWGGWSVVPSCPPRCTPPTLRVAPPAQATRTQQEYEGRSDERKALRGSEASSRGPGSERRRSGQPVHSRGSAGKAATFPTGCQRRTSTPGVHETPAATLRPAGRLSGLPPVTIRAVNVFSLHTLRCPHFTFSIPPTTLSGANVKSFKTCMFLPKNIMYKKNAHQLQDGRRVSCTQPCCYRFRRQGPEIGPFLASRMAQ